MAPKPYDFRQIRPMEGSLVFCADGIHCNHFAILLVFPCVFQGHESICVQALLPKATDRGFDMSVVGRCTEHWEYQLN